MLLSEVADILNAKVLTGQTREELDQVEVLMACGSDLMSDVLAFVKTQGLLLTGLINQQVIRTAEMMDMKAICFVRGKTPDESVIELAKDRDIVILSSNHTLYVACGKLYNEGLHESEG